MIEGVTIPLSDRALARPKGESMSMTEPQFDEYGNEIEPDEEAAAAAEKKARDNDRAQQRIQSQRDEAQAEAQKAKKELLFVKAGIDTDSKLGKLLLNSYDGDMTVDAIKAEAVEVGALEAPEAPKGPDITPEEAQSTDERSQLAVGAQAETTLDPDSYGTALRLGNETLDKGGNFESAFANALRYVAADERNWQRVQ